MTGSVTPFRAAIINVPVFWPNGRHLDIEFTIDTGFTSYLALPKEIITYLELPRRSQMKSTVADGRRITSPTFDADVLWQEAQRGVLVLALETVPLLGMSLLYGFDLHIPVVDGGTATITPLP